MSPIIGIPTRKHQTPKKGIFVGTHLSYVDKIVRTGATPILIYCGTDVSRILDVVDGILLAGGENLDATYYSSVPQCVEEKSDLDRDKFEIELVRKSMDIGIPILGICRGMQVINCALGGSLTTNDGQYSHQLHSNYSRSYIEVDKNSLLSSIVGDSIEAKCNHSSFISKIGLGIIPVAFSSDRSIEAIESKDHKILAVHWHPEMEKLDSPSLKLFTWLVERSSELNR